MQLRLFIVFCLLVFLGSSAKAGTILFTNLIQPGDQYGPDGVGIGHTPAFPNPGDYLNYAVRFTPSTTASLTSFEAPLGVVSGPNQLQANLMSDSGGAPGAIVASFTLSGLPGAPGPLLSIAAGSNLVVLGGQPYWFAVTGGPQTFGIWTLNLFQGDPNDGGASQIVINGIQPSWTVGTGSRTGALQVFGDPVPEPSYAPLVSCALVVIAGSRIRNRKQCRAE